MWNPGRCGSPSISCRVNPGGARNTLVRYGDLGQLWLAQGHFLGRSDHFRLARHNPLIVLIADITGQGHAVFAFFGQYRQCHRQGIVQLYRALES